MHDINKNDIFEKFLFRLDLIMTYHSRVNEQTKKKKC